MCSGISCNIRNVKCNFIINLINCVFIFLVFILNCAIFNLMTNKYDINKLGYYEIFSKIEDAIIREKQIKGGSRKKKIDLIESINPYWEDLYYKIT